ncbi:FecR domain-containing protein [Pseudomonas sp. JQ170]|uniref:FecR domain-containing protein n=1 Tax=unclassified Pseudomonas TaxID=196821 RepID=UPI002656ACF2|nr:MULTISPECIES: FecR domain-containing protein [unclassified Pseudomonas]MDN7143695.1 FecR domain-containing protein [Pseudomonas sp. JQ170]WRO74136.1 FecR domain-containing protein [Pseudomonas sp. 170C]
MTAARQRQALRDAAQWHACLGAAPECRQTQQNWQAWHQSDAMHQWAWQRLEAFNAELRGVPVAVAQRALAADPVMPARRTLLKGLVLGLGVSGLAWTGYRQTPQWLADVRTATGERRELTLHDGTRLTLNTASAVDIRYTANQRLIVLHAGEIMLQTGKDSRPLSVLSPHGEMRALGTRFSVRLDDELTELDVIEQAVEVRNQTTAVPRRVEAGMSLHFGHGPLPLPRPLDPNRAEWVNGSLVIDDWPLHRVLTELQRYRPGFIDCARDVAHLRLSGAYPLDDTTRALAAIAQVLPVRIETRTRFWVRVRGLG